MQLGSRAFTRNQFRRMCQHAARATSNRPRAVRITVVASERCRWTKSVPDL